MPKITAFALQDSKEDPGRYRVWLLDGNDSLLRQRAYEYLMERFLTTEEREFNQDTVSAAEVSAPEILTMVSMLPFLSSCRVVTVRNAERLTADSQKQITGRLDRLPETTRLILLRSSGEGRSAREPKGKTSLEAKIADQGMVVDCNAPMKDALKAWVVSEAKLKGLRIEPVAAGLLCEFIGPDLGRLAMEIEKIALYLSDAPASTAKAAPAASTITKALVQKLVQRTAEETVFKLTDAVAEKKVAVAIHALDELMSETDNAHMILAMLIRQFRLLIQAKWLLEQGYLRGAPSTIPQEVASRLPKTHNILPILKNQSWIATKLAQQAKAFSQPDLARAFNRLLHADLSLKGIQTHNPHATSHDPKMTMQLLVVDLCGGKNA